MTTDEMVDWLEHTAKLLNIPPKPYGLSDAMCQQQIGFLKAIAARLSELQARVSLLDAADREMTALRTQNRELDLQYRQLWCATWNCPIDDFLPGSHHSAVTAAQMNIRDAVAWRHFRERR